MVGLGSLGVTLGIFLVHYVLRCAGDFASACWWELMDDETSSRYIFLFMLLLIPFLVIGLSIKVLNISNSEWALRPRLHDNKFTGYRNLDS